MKLTYDKKLNDYICHADKPCISVIEVTPQTNYSLLLTFSNGEKKVYDAKPLLDKKIYSKLKDISFFMSAKADGCSVFWNDDIDIAPEHLYEHSTPEERSIENV